MEEEKNRQKNWRVFWPSWLAPFVLISPVIYGELFGELPKFVSYLAMGGCLVMLARPLGAYSLKRLSFGRVAFFGFVIPFLIWAVLVFANIAVVALLKAS